MRFVRCGTIGDEDEHPHGVSASLSLEETEASTATEAEAIESPTAETLWKKREASLQREIADYRNSKGGIILVQASKRPRKASKRAVKEAASTPVNHNLLERQRRSALKKQFDELLGILNATPSRSPTSASKTQILHMAKKDIEALKSLDARLNLERNRLKERQERLIRKLFMLKTKNMFV